MPTLMVNKSYQLDIPEYGAHLHIDQLQSLVKRSGSHFFDRDTMRFFRSRVDYNVYAGPDGWYFVTSEQHVMHYPVYRKEPRLYTVRCLRLNAAGDDLDILEFEDFQHFKTLNGARAAAKRLAQHGAKPCTECRLRLVKKDDERGICAECLGRIARRGQPTT